MDEERELKIVEDYKYLLYHVGRITNILVAYDKGEKALENKERKSLIAIMSKHLERIRMIREDHSGVDEWLYIYDKQNTN